MVAWLFDLSLLQTMLKYQIVAPERTLCRSNPSLSALNSKVTASNTNPLLPKAKKYNQRGQVNENSYLKDSTLR